MKRFEDFNIIYVPSGDDKEVLFSAEDNREWLMQYKDKFDTNTLPGVCEYTEFWGEKTYHILLDNPFNQCVISYELGYVTICDYNRTDMCHYIAIGYIESGSEADEFIEWIRSMVTETYDGKEWKNK